MQNDEKCAMMERLLTCKNRFHKLNLQKIQTELSQGEYAVLKVIMYLLDKENNTQVSISLIAKKLCVSLSYISREVSKLEKRGYIIRKADEKDKRNNLVEVTKEGMEKYLQVDASLNAFFSELDKKFGEERIEQLVSMLEEMNELAESMLEEY